MAQTQLNRVYVQSIDGTGVTVNTLSIGTKALTSGITIGGAGTAANTITVDSGGVRINSSTTLEGTTTIPNLNATTAIVSGNTSLQNTSTLHLGVRGNASIVNASINALTVVGQTTLGNASITNLGVTSQMTIQNATLTGTLGVTGLTTMVNVSTTNLTVINNVSIGGNVSIIGSLRSLRLETGNASLNGTLSVAGQTVLQNTSVNTTLNVDGTTTLRILNVNGQANLNAGLNVTGATSVTGNFTSSSLTINSGTVLNNVSLTTLTVSGNSSLNAVDIRGAVNINTGGAATTTIGSTNSRTVIANVSTSDMTVTGTLWATANTSLNNVSAQALTVGPLWTTSLASLTNGLTATGATAINKTGTAITEIGSTGVGSRTVIGNTSMNGGIDINTAAAATSLTTIGSATSRTIIGNMSTSNTTVTGSLWVTGATAINKTGTTLTEIGSTGVGSRTVIGNTSIIGGVDINTTGTSLTTIGSATSLTVIGNMSTSNTTVTGSLWVTGATEINKSGAGITEIGSTASGSRTVIGNTSIIGGVDINSTSLTMTTIGNTQAGSRTVIGNTSMNGSIDINTTGTGITTMGSDTSSTVVKGDMSVTKLLTSGYTPGLYNYAPTFFAAGFSGGNVSTSDGPEYGFTLSAATANVASISPVSFLANKKYIVNFNARTSVLGPKVTILGSPIFDLTTTNTLYRQVVTATANTTTLSLAISGGASGNKIIWSLLTIEPFYDMTLGSNQISLGGEINVSAGNPFTDWDPTRMLFTTSSITIGANPRIAIGKNTVTNTSTYVATCDGTVGNVSGIYFGSTDGVTWSSSNLWNVSMPRGIAYHEVNSSFYVVTGESPAKVWTNTTGVTTWGVLTTPTLTMNSATNIIYGNSNLVAYNASTANNIMYSLNATGWNSVPTQVPISITDMAYGRMTTFTTNGIYVFVACGTNAFYRNSTTSANSHLPSDWGLASGTKPVGTWAFVGFGNDTFIAASNDATGKVSRSTDAGVNWQTPILLNEILTSEPIFLESTWFIGSNTGLYVSKDNGLTWTKRVGNSLTRSVYGGRFVDVGTSLSLITKRNQRTDGSSISPDVITIGLEGSTTNIENLVARNVNVSTIGYGQSNTLSIASNINVSMGSPTTMFTITYSSVLARYSVIAYGAGRFVIIGDPSKVYYSTNGTTWTQSTTTTFNGNMRSLVYAKDRFMIVTENSTTTYVYTSMDGGVTWNQVSTAPSVSIYRCAYGNDSVVGIVANSANITVSSSSTGTAWTNITISGVSLVGVCFGTMRTGTNVFLLLGQNVIRRNPGPTLNDLIAPGNWATPTTPPGNGAWTFAGFGNDTFMVTSSDTIGLLTISTDGGVNWSTPINFGVTLRQPIYIDGEWYIGGSDSMMISKNNGLTWEKKILGFDNVQFAYGNGLFVSVNFTGNSNNSTNLIGLTKTKNDGYNITSDVITLGSLSTTTAINGNNTTISGNNTAISGNNTVINGANVFINGFTYLSSRTRFSTSSGQYKTGYEPTVEIGGGLSFLNGPNNAASNKIVWYYSWSMWGSTSSGIYFYYGNDPEAATDGMGIARINPSGSFITISDINKKQNIKDLTYGLDTIQNLRPVSFSYKTNANSTELGFIAQEVEAFVPEIIDDDGKEDTIKGLKYIGFVPILVKALQEMKLGYDAKFQELKLDYDAKISNLEARLLALEQKTSV